MIQYMDKLPNSIYVKEDYIGHRYWTPAGIKYRELISLLSKLRVTNYKRIIK